MGEKLKERELYELLKAEGIPDDINGPPEWAELAGYELPPNPATWESQARAVRRVLSEQKYTRRAGRPHGGSVVKSDQIEHLRGRDD